MANLNINHVLSRLLRDSVIEQSKKSTLFDTLMHIRSDVEQRLRELGMELVVIPDAGIAHARNMSDEQLDSMSEELDVEPITPVCSHQRLSYYASVAVIYFRMSLDQEMRQGGDPIWISRNEVYDALAKHYSEAVAEDRAALEERINKCLSRLVDDKLITMRSMGPSSTFRGAPLMLAAFSRDAMAHFVEEMNLLADKEGSELTEKESLVSFDTIEPATA